jgi:hypothetical protein
MLVFVFLVALVVLIIVTIKPLYPISCSKFFSAAFPLAMPMPISQRAIQFPFFPEKTLKSFGLLFMTGEIHVFFFPRRPKRSPACLRSNRNLTSA